MAILPSFYNQVDQDIYEGGDHFIPREQYRLNYTPSTSLASTVGNTGGVTGTEAAYPYIWPPQEGRDNTFSNTNKFGLDLDTMKTINMGRYVEKGGPGNMYGGNYIKDSRKIAKDASGNWKDVETNQNVYHANLHNVKGIVGTVGDWLTGKSKNKDTRIGTWTGAEWDEDFDPTVSHKDLNVYTRWKAKKEFKAAQQKAADDKIAASKAAVKASGADVGHYDPQAGGASHLTRGRDQGGLGLTQEEAESIAEANKDVGGWKLAQGGRIGYRERGFVDPEEPAENIFEIMQDQGVPFSEQVEADPFRMRIQELMGKGLSYEDAYDIAEMEFQDLFAEGSEQDQGGLASIV